MKFALSSGRALFCDVNLCFNFVVRKKHTRPKLKAMAQPVIFRTLEPALKVLNEHKQNESVNELLSIYKQKHDENAENLRRSDSKRHPLIVLEGLDCCGKSTITKVLSKRINAKMWCTPPKCVGHLREQFDNDAVLRTAFYCIGNYIAALEVSTLLKEEPVVMDRFWHSTAAYAIAQAEQSHPDLYKMPEKGDGTYQWPEDLFKPDYVFLLNVSEAVRLERFARRKTTRTDQEQLLKSDNAFRQNILKAYDCMINPGVVYVNSDVPVKSVVENILKLLEPTSL